MSAMRWPAAATVEAAIASSPLPIALPWVLQKMQTTVIILLSYESISQLARATWRVGQANPVRGKGGRVDQRVVVTGMGAVSALGLSLAETWAGLVDGRSGVRPIESFNTEGFPVRIAASVGSLDAVSVLQRKDVRRACRYAHLAMAAALEAVADAGLNLAAEDPTRIGLIIGSAVGGIGSIEEQTVHLFQGGVRRVNPVLVPMVIVNAATCLIAVQLGIQGIAQAPAAACATGVIALGDALHCLRRGDADVVLAGGADAPITPLTLAGFSRLGALSARNDDPAHACRPFDATRDGAVLGEGAAILVLETAAHAERRGATVLAEVAGYGLTVDAYHMTVPEPTGAGARRAMSLALADSGLGPAEIDLIVAHGTGTALNDVAETRAIHAVFGERGRRVAVTSNKGAIGHTMGAAGAISAAAAVQAMRTGLLPPTTNLVTPDAECELDHVVGRARPATVRAALVNAIGFGGQNASLVLRSWN